LQNGYFTFDLSRASPLRRRVQRDEIPGDAKKSIRLQDGKRKRGGAGGGGREGMKKRNGNRRAQKKARD